jgi:hypothetical protein
VKWNLTRERRDASILVAPSALVSGSRHLLPRQAKSSGELAAGSCPPIEKDFGRRFIRCAEAREAGDSKGCLYKSFRRRALWCGRRDRTVTVGIPSVTYEDGLTEPPRKPMLDLRITS